MTTYDTITTREARFGSGLVTTLLNAVREIVRRHQEHRIIVKLSRMESRLLRDMGLDPAAIYRAVDGTWDEVDHGRFREI